MMMIIFLSSLPWSMTDAWTLPRGSSHRSCQTPKTTTCARSSSQSIFISHSSFSTRLGTSSLNSPSSTTNTNTAARDIQIAELKAEIESLRQEALARLEVLNQEFSHPSSIDHRHHHQAVVVSPSTATTATTKTVTMATPEPPAVVRVVGLPGSTTTTTLSSKETTTTSVVDPHFLEPIEDRESLHFLESVTEDDLTMTTASVNNRPSTSHSKSLKLLEGTRWRVMMNIGREPGTWMTKTWGASGDRLRLHLELEFTEDQLYEREDFLNGFSGAQVLRVVDSQADLAPCLSHGGKKIRIKPQSGGWRVAPKEGPMGTSVLRFYFDLEEEARHAGSDVFCPAGRIYFTCGYFNMEERKHRQGGGYMSEKDLLKEEMRLIEATYEGLATENEFDTDFFSWKKLQRSKQLMDLRSQATKISQKMHDAHIREPDKSHLRLSRDQSVGLTKEGGVCCKVHQGLAIEYHILGKFEIASMENRPHSDYKELLP